MAGETLASSLTEIINSEWISPLIQDAATNFKNPTQFFAPISPGFGTASIAVARWDSNEGTIPDDGVGVDTEFNATEGGALTAIEMTTSDATFSIIEYAVMREPSLTVLEDNLLGDGLINRIVDDGVNLLMGAFNDDACALFASLSGSSGVSGTNCRVVDFDDALNQITDRGVHGDLVAVLDVQAANDLSADLQATGTSMAVFAGTADKMLALETERTGGRNPEGYAFTLKGVPVYKQALCDTANAGADVVSAVFVRGDIPANGGMAAFGQAQRRTYQVQTQPQVAKRTIQVVCSMRAGCGITRNASGQKLVTDA